MKRLPSPKAGLMHMPVADEVLVYGLGRVHCLNRLAGLVLEACREQSTRAEAVAAVARSVGLESTRAEDLLDLALRELRTAGLIEGADSDGLSRRDLLRRCGILAVAVPTVVSLAAPAAAQATSFCCLPFDQVDPNHCGNLAEPADCSCRCSDPADPGCTTRNNLCGRKYEISPGGSCTTDPSANACIDLVFFAAQYHPDCATARQQVVVDFCGGDDSACTEVDDYYCCACS